VEWFKNGRMEGWKNVKPKSNSCLQLFIMERKNVNRGFRKLRVWQDSIIPSFQINSDKSKTLQNSTP
jgi:hypothetical protein